MYLHTAGGKTLLKDQKRCIFLKTEVSIMVEKRGSTGIKDHVIGV